MAGRQAGPRAGLWSYPKCLVRTDDCLDTSPIAGGRAEKRKKEEDTLERKCEECCLPAPPIDSDTYPEARRDPLCSRTLFFTLEKCTKHF